VAAVVSLNGIDETIKNLDYKTKDSLKLRWIRAIRVRYPDELALTTLQAVDPDTLVNVMEWSLDRGQIGENGDRPCYIVKGGSWASTSDICLCSCFKMPPDARSNILGFRCLAF
jgi:hypothetical protein